MDKKTEALKLALKALLSCSAGDYSTGHIIHPSFDVDAVNKAIEAIDALAKQPTRYATTIGEGNLSANGFEGDWFKKPAQPSKPWVPLTDDEIDAIYMGAGKHDLIRAREIETKLREKNS